MKTPLAPVVAHLVFVVVATACGSSDPTMCEDDIAIGIALGHAIELNTAETRAGNFRKKGFERVTPELRTSQVPPKEDGPVHIALWASDDSAHRYEGIDPIMRTDASSDGDAFPVDTILMREVRTSDNHQNDAESVKIMAKLSRGYAPGRKDWWFGERLPDGTVRTAEQPCECMGCHILHEATDYVVGAPPVGFEPEPVGAGPYG